jgi:hypothetical protein
MTRRLPLLFAALLTGSLLLSACDSTGANEKEEPAETATLVTVEDLPADPDTTSGPGRPQGYGQFAFFNLRDSSIVLHSDAQNRSDSASTKWDIAFQSVDIIVNGGQNGPGDGAAYVAEKPFQEVTEVNTDSLTSDRIEDWYTYNANGNNIVRPTPGRTLVVRTADGESYAKIRILSYYEGAPDNPAESDAESRYYTFEYVLQTDGTSFE